jgi:hypothetical protein
MPSLRDNNRFMFRWFFVYDVLGIAFASIREFCVVLSSFVFGESHENMLNVDQFVFQSWNLHYLNEKHKPTFCDFTNYCLDKGLPIGALLLSDQDKCNECGKNLVLDEEWKPVVVYHVTRGTFLGCRLTKRCNRCKIYEHYGYTSKNGQKTYHSDFGEREFLLSTEDTAIDVNMLRYTREEFVQGAMPFNLKADVYNSVHGYAYTCGSLKDEER